MCPQAPPRPCRVCHRIYCQQHSRWYRPNLRPRIRGEKLQKIRLAMYAADPHCAHCKRVLDPTAFELDHVKALAHGGEDIDTNRQLLCVPCHQAKTKQELSWR